MAILLLAASSATAQMIQNFNEPEEESLKRVVELTGEPRAPRSPLMVQAATAAYISYGVPPHRQVLTMIQHEIQKLSLPVHSTNASNCACEQLCVRARVRVCVCALRADRSEDGRLGSGCGRLECDVACRDGGAETSHE